MALNKTQLKNSLRSLCDKTAGGFIGFPVTGALAASNFAGAINTYALGITPISTSHLAAKTACTASLISGFSARNIKSLELAITAYVTAMIPGMLPTFTGVPPTSILDFSAIFGSAVQNNVTAEQIISELADIIHAWLRTGRSINVQTGAIINWT